MFHKILIANRGEIAVRIIRACKEMGIGTVAVYSEADKDAMHTRLADESICIGPAVSTKSYLNIPAIMTAASLTDVSAIHPGYGFLAENAEFAEIVIASGYTWIGPSPKSMRIMGDKVRAKQKMREAGVPLVYGSEGAVRSVEEAKEVAKLAGFPLIIKAAAGGGGRGMKIVHSEPSLPNAFSLCQSEAGSVFGDETVFIEQFWRSRVILKCKYLAMVMATLCIFLSVNARFSAIIKRCWKKRQAHRLAKKPAKQFVLPAWLLPKLLTTKAQARLSFYSTLTNHSISWK